MKDTKKICDAIEVMLDACAEIKDSGKCNSRDCPMFSLCLEETSFIEVADLLYSEKAEEFLKVADL